MNSPFNGITELQKNKLFKLLETHTFNFSKNEEIWSTLRNDNNICILLEGYADITYTDYNGEESLVESLSPNDIFGSHISNLNYNEYQIKSLENSKVLVIDYNKLLNTQNISYPYYNLFITNLFDIINIKFKERNNRIKILKQKSIRDKLLTFFEIEYTKTRSKVIYLPNNFKDLADYLAVNRSAMFRELKYLKEENFIKVDGKRITLLYTPSV